jgi:hypothetical protein
MSTRITEIINFLDDCAPNRIARMRSQGKPYELALIPDLAGVNDPALKILAETAVAALDELDNLLGPMLSDALKEAHSKRRYEMLAMGCTTVAALATTAMTALPDVPVWLKLASAGITALGAIFTWISGNQKSKLLDTDIKEHVAILIDAGVYTKQWKNELTTLLGVPSDQSEKVGGLIEKVNGLLRDVNRTKIAIRFAVS